LIQIMIRRTTEAATAAGAVEGCSSGCSCSSAAGASCACACCSAMGYNSRDVSLLACAFSCGSHTHVPCNSCSDSA
jgi:hypothetical protein